jgi:Ca2+-binding RTX toxin-like protein
MAATCPRVSPRPNETPSVPTGTGDDLLSGGIMMQITFKAGLFGASAGDALDYQFANFGFSDSGSGSVSDSYDIGVAGADYELGVRYDLAFGLTGTAHLDLGHIDGTLSYTETATTSDKASVDGTVKAYVDTAGSTIDESSFSVTAPSADDSYLSIGMVASLKADLFGHLGGWYDIGFDWDDTRSDFDTNIVDVKLDEEVLKLSAADLGGLDGELYRVDLGFGELAAALPEFEFGDVETDGDGPLAVQHMTGVSSPFLTMEIDLDSFLLPVGNSFDYSYGLFDDGIQLGVDIGVIDAKLVGTASLEQDITWTPDIDVTMKSSFGETLTGELGDAFEFTTPEGEGSFTVTASYHSLVTVATVTTLILATSLDWKIGYGEAYVALDILGYQDKWGFDVGLIEGSEPLGLGVNLELSSDTSVYDLGSETHDYTVWYENFVTAASGEVLTLTTHQLSVEAGDIDNLVFGNLLDNVLKGNGGDDVLRGRSGNDTLSGGDGDDRLFAGRGGDTLFGGDGQDIAVFRNAAAGMTIDLGLGTATGKATTTLDGIERVSGTRFADTLIGSDRNDWLAGDAGADRFVFKPVSTGGHVGIDRIVDFSGHGGEGDRIDLTAFGFKAFAELRITDAGHGQSLVTGDADGDGTLDLRLRITSDAPLTADDFAIGRVFQTTAPDVDTLPPFVAVGTSHPADLHGLI